MWIDFGFETEEETMQHTKYGDYITLYSDPKIFGNGKRITSKALDNKICVFILIEVLKRLSKIDIPLNIVGIAIEQ